MDLFTQMERVKPVSSPPMSALEEGQISEAEMEGVIQLIDQMDSMDREEFIARLSKLRPPETGIVGLCFRVILRKEASPAGDRPLLALLGSLYLWGPGR